MLLIDLKKWGDYLIFRQWKHNLSAISCTATTFIFDSDFFGNWGSTVFLWVFYNANIWHDNLTDNIKLVHQKLPVFEDA